MNTSQIDDIGNLQEEDKTPLGYFIKVEEGQKVTLPIQAALYMAKAGEKQIIHNIVILEDNSELEFITGCVTKQGIQTGEHIAVSETYVGKNAKETSAEIAHRAVCTGGKIIQRGLLIGKEKCHAHVDCSGMLITPGEEGFIESIPGVKAYHEDARMSHEASIGKIAPSEVQYLMTHGMDEREAISMIIRGFLDSDIKGLGPELDIRIAEIAELAGHGED